MNGGYVRISAPCGAGQTAHEQAIEWILDRHAIQAERFAQPPERPAGRRTGAEPEAGG